MIRLALTFLFATALLASAQDVLLLKNGSSRIATPKSVTWFFSKTANSLEDHGHLAESSRSSLRHPMAVSERSVSRLQQVNTLVRSRRLIS